MYKCQILKLILQPIVENSLLHGLKYMKTGGIISIQGILIESKIIFTITDNGIGVDLERIESILNGYEDKSSYGIKNVNERIMLEYGKQYRLIYSNVPGGGTSVKLVIPIKGIKDSIK